MNVKELDTWSVSRLGDGSYLVRIAGSPKRPVLGAFTDLQIDETATGQDVRETAGLALMRIFEAVSQMRKAANIETEVWPTSVKAGPA